MQTFLPYPDLQASCVVLDDRRLGKQRVETFQILRALTWPDYAWKNHPAVTMWRGFVPALVEYGLASCREWVRRGYADSVATQLLAWTGGEEPTGAPLPPWWGWEALHLSHRSNLLRKDPAHYRPLFGDEPDDLPYVWPAPVFPRWPVHGGTAGVSLGQAARLLGLEQPLPVQAAVAGAVVAGQDVLLVARPGSGGSTTGLLAGLVTPGRTLWVSPPPGAAAGAVPELELPAPRVVPAGDRAPAVARPPGPAELAAMRAEAEEPEFVFATAATLPPVRHRGLMVVDRAHEVSDPEAVAAARAEDPVLLLVPRADAEERRHLVAAFGLRDPLHLGVGWDPAGTWLDAVPAGTPAQQRLAIEQLVRSGGPALVVASDRQRAERTATALLGRGLRAAVWAPPPMRGTRAAAAVADWRGRRLDALVVPAGPSPQLGRRRPGLVVDASGDGLEAWRDRLAELAPERSVLVTEAVPDGCLRAALLGPYGQPVDVPCGRCAACVP